MTSIIRPERPGDEDAIRAIVTAAFPTPAEARLVDALRDAGALTVSVVAEQDGALVGHVAFSPVTVGTNPRQIRVLGLAPVAVAPKMQKQGMGKMLIRTGLDAAGRVGAGAVILPGRVGYYSRFGFESAKASGLTWGDGAHDDYLQVIGLGQNALDGLSGAVGYHTAFDTLY